MGSELRTSPDFKWLIIAGTGPLNIRLCIQFCNHVNRTTTDFKRPLVYLITGPEIQLKTLTKWWWDHLISGPVIKWHRAIGTICPVSEWS